MYIRRVDPFMGKPSPDTTNPDYIPSVFVHSQTADKEKDSEIKSMNWDRQPNPAHAPTNMPHRGPANADMAWQMPVAYGGRQGSQPGQDGAGRQGYPSFNTNGLGRGASGPPCSSPTFLPPPPPLVRYAATSSAQPTCSNLGQGAFPPNHVAPSFPMTSQPGFNPQQPVQQRSVAAQSRPVMQPHLQSQSQPQMRMVNGNMGNNNMGNSNMGNSNMGSFPQPAHQHPGQSGPHLGYQTRNPSPHLNHSPTSPLDQFSPVQQQFQHQQHQQQQQQHPRQQMIPPRMQPERAPGQPGQFPPGSTHMQAGGMFQPNSGLPRQNYPNQPRMTGLNTATPVSQIYQQNLGQPRQTFAQPAPVPPRMPSPAHQAQTGPLPPPPPYRPRAPTHAGQVPTLAGQVPIHTGQVPTHAGKVPAHAGQVPTHAGQVSTHAGQVPAHAGQVPQQPDFTRYQHPNHRSHPAQMVRPPLSRFTSPQESQHYKTSDGQLRPVAEVLTAIRNLNNLDQDITKRILQNFALKHVPKDKPVPEEPCDKALLGRWYSLPDTEQPSTAASVPVVTRSEPAVTVPVNAKVSVNTVTAPSDSIPTIAVGQISSGLRLPVSQSTTAQHSSVPDRVQPPVDPTADIRVQTAGNQPIARTTGYLPSDSRTLNQPGNQPGLHEPSVPGHVNQWTDQIAGSQLGAEADDFIIPSIATEDVIEYKVVDLLRYLKKFHGRYQQQCRQSLERDVSQPVQPVAQPVHPVGMPVQQVGKPVAQEIIIKLEPIPATGQVPRIDDHSLPDMFLTETSRRVTEQLMQMRQEFENQNLNFTGTAPFELLEGGVQPHNTLNTAAVQKRNITEDTEQDKIDEGVFEYHIPEDVYGENTETEGTYPYTIEPDPSISVNDKENSVTQGSAPAIADPSNSVNIKGNSVTQGSAPTIADPSNSVNIKENSVTQGSAPAIADPSNSVNIKENSVTQGSAPAIADPSNSVNIKENSVNQGSGPASNKRKLDSTDIDSEAVCSGSNKKSRGTRGRGSGSGRGRGKELSPEKATSSDGAPVTAARGRGGRGNRGARRGKGRGSRGADVFRQVIRGLGSGSKADGQKRKELSPEKAVSSDGAPVTAARGRSGRGSGAARRGRGRGRGRGMTTSETETYTSKQTTLDGYLKESPQTSQLVSLDGTSGVNVAKRKKTKHVHDNIPDTDPSSETTEPPPAVVTVKQKEENNSSEGDNIQEQTAVATDQDLMEVKENISEPSMNDTGNVSDTSTILRIIDTSVNTTIDDTSVNTRLIDTSVNTSPVETIVISDSYKMTWIRFHGKVTTRLITPEGFFFLVKEIFRRCFRIQAAEKRNQMIKIQRIMKSVLKIKETELHPAMLPFVIKNLKDRKVIKTVPETFMMIKETDAMALFHYIYKDKFCEDGCTSVFYKEATSASSIVVSGTVQVDQTSEPATPTKQISVAEEKVTPVREPVSQIIKSPTVTPDRNIFDVIGGDKSYEKKGAKGKGSGKKAINKTLINLCSDGEEDGYETDKTLPYVDGSPQDKVTTEDNDDHADYKICDDAVSVSVVGDMKGFLSNNSSAADKDTVIVVDSDDSEEEDIPTQEKVTISEKRGDESNHDDELLEAEKPTDNADQSESLTSSQSTDGTRIGENDLISSLKNIKKLSDSLVNKSKKSSTVTSEKAEDSDVVIIDSSETDTDQDNVTDNLDKSDVASSLFRQDSRKSRHSSGHSDQEKMPDKSDTKPALVRRNSQKSRHSSGYSDQEKMPDKSGQTKPALARQDSKKTRHSSGHLNQENVTDNSGRSDVAASLVGQNSKKSRTSSGHSDKEKMPDKSDTKPALVRQDSKKSRYNSGHSDIQEKMPESRDTRPSLVRQDSQKSRTSSGDSNRLTLSERSSDGEIDIEVKGRLGSTEMPFMSSCGLTDTDIMARKVKQCIEKANNADDMEMLADVCYEVLEFTKPLEDLTKKYLSQIDQFAIDQSTIMEVERKQLLAELSSNSEPVVIDLDMMGETRPPIVDGVSAEMDNGT